MARVFSLFQDLFIMYLLFSILSISPLLSFCLSCLISLYVAFDAFLYRRLKLRLQWSDIFYLRNASTLFHSAKEMGSNQFFIVISCLVLGHIGGYFFFRSFQVSWDGIILATLATLALCSRLFLPQSTGYALHHPFFFKQRTFSLSASHLFKKPQTGSQTFSIRIEKGEKPHIVFLFLESFPEKYVGSGVVPHFNRLIQEGIYFSQFYSNGTLTYRSFLNGLFGTPPKNTSVGLSPYVDVPFRGIPEFLKEKGYKTAFHQSGSLSFDFQDRFLEKHFDELADKDCLNVPLSQHTGWGVPDEYLMQYSANWLEKQTGPSFLTLFTISNHHPWVVPKTYTSYQKNRFLQTLEYTDYALGQFVGHLRDKGLTQKTILFILGDHGQPRGEHQDNFYNSRFLYEENVHIPLLILAEKRLLEPRRIDQIGSQIDLLPTVMDLMGEKENCLGTSLLRTCPDKTVFLQNPYSEGFLGCRKGSWKWIENSCSKAQELYDLTQDKEEMHNLAESHHEIAAALQKETHSFFAQVETFYQHLRTMIDSKDLDLSNSLITDEKLQTLITSELRTIRLDHCLLLTDRGIACLFERCPLLEQLHLKGIIGLTDKAFEGVYPRLKTLDISDAMHVTAEKITHSFPYLQELSFNVKSSTSFPICHLTQLKLFDAHHLTDDHMAQLLQNNPDLFSLTIHGCTQITDQTLFKMKNLSLEALSLFNAPHISEKGLEAIASMPLRSFNLYRS